MSYVPHPAMGSLLLRCVWSANPGYGDRAGATAAWPRKHGTFSVRFTRGKSRVRNRGPMWAQHRVALDPAGPWLWTTATRAGWSVCVQAIKPLSRHSSNVIGAWPVTSLKSKQTTLLTWTTSSRTPLPRCSNRWLPARARTRASVPTCSQLSGASPIRSIVPDRGPGQRMIPLSWTHRMSIMIPS